MVVLHLHCQKCHRQILTCIYLYIVYMYIHVYIMKQNELILVLHDAVVYMCIYTVHIHVGHHRCSYLHVMYTCPSCTLCTLKQYYAFTCTQD